MARSGTEREEDFSFGKCLHSIQLIETVPGSPAIFQSFQIKTKTTKISHFSLKSQLPLLFITEY